MYCAHIIHTYNTFTCRMSVGGPRKKRKTTMVEKMENAMKVLYEKYSAQQERARKEAR